MLKLTITTKIQNMEITWSSIYNSFMLNINVIGTDFCKIFNYDTLKNISFETEEEEVNFTLVYYNKDGITETYTTRKRKFVKTILEKYIHFYNKDCHLEGGKLSINVLDDLLVEPIYDN